MSFKLLLNCKSKNPAMLFTPFREVLLITYHTIEDMQVLFLLFFQAQKTPPRYYSALLSAGTALEGVKIKYIFI